MKIKIEWTQRVAGRQPGDIETVESTPFIQGCIKQRRAKVLEEIVPVAKKSESDLIGLSKPVPRPPRTKSRNAE